MMAERFTRLLDAQRNKRKLCALSLRETDGMYHVPGDGKVVSNLLDHRIYSSTCGRQRSVVDGTVRLAGLQAGGTVFDDSRNNNSLIFLFTRHTERTHPLVVGLVFINNLDHPPVSTTLAGFRLLRRKLSVL